MVHLTSFYHSSKNVFRTSFQLKNKSVFHWFPGHMSKGVKQMQQKLKTVDCVVEVHDARIPFSGRNPEAFQTISGLRPHILVYNKRDLADPSLETEILNMHEEKGFKNVIFTNCKNTRCEGMRKLIPMIQKELSLSNRYNRTENQDKCLMIIGVPNVGKSSLINVLRMKYLLKGSAAPVGAAPGITRSVGFKIKISSDPLIYVLDTPGILTPKVPSVDDGMKLALCATIPDKEVGIELVADYLLFWLNKHNNFQYVDFLNIEKASDDITEVLLLSAIRKNSMLKIKGADGGYILQPNITASAFTFVDGFRRGLFGKITLDVDQINSRAKESRRVIQKRMDTFR